MSTQKLKIYCTFVALLAILVGCSQKVEKIGEYTEIISVSDYGKTQAENWLSSAWMSDEINIDDYMEIPSLSVNVTLYSDNTYVQEVDIDSYNTAIREARNGLANALRELIIIRYKASGKIPENQDITGEDIDAIMLEKTGLTLEDYVTEYGPELIMPLDRLQLTYNVSGNFALEQ